MDTFIKQITKEAGELVGKKFGKVGVKYTKRNVTDVVTEADLAANKYIVGAIKKKYPSHSIISEETGENGVQSEYTWIIDPLDGTLNFATKVPLFGTMIGLAHKGKMILAAIYFPCTKELLFAKKGKGAYLNGKKVSCSSKKNWTESYGILDVYTAVNAPLSAKILATDTKGMCMTSAHGSSAIDALYIATGRRDWQFINLTEVWDITIPALILEESGCTLTTPEGKPWSLDSKKIVVANKYLHPTLLKIVNTK